MHAVNIGPYLHFFAADTSPDQGCGIVAAAPPKVINLAETVTADIPLGDEYVIIRVLVEQWG
ncbi:hypothetical protein GALL_494850 [mine drainage metagenome]|uniref:Uncharacterized protein n=1 Tax=mine drainage metagenome TaxID=410659 RepID=A0A1J5PZ49_9ZZZZ